MFAGSEAVCIGVLAANAKDPTENSLDTIKVAAIIYGLAKVIEIVSSPIVAIQYSQDEYPSADDKPIRNVPPEWLGKPNATSRSRSDIPPEWLGRTSVATQVVEMIYTMLDKADDDDFQNAVKAADALLSKGALPSAIVSSTLVYLRTNPEEPISKAILHSEVVE